MLFRNDLRLEDSRGVASAKIQVLPSGIVKNLGWVGEGFPPPYVENL